MKNEIKILILLMTTIFMTSCEDEVEDFNGPYRLAIIGATTVAPETTKEYSLQRLENDDSYTWTIEGPATIVGDPSGTGIAVNYESVGHVILTVTNGSNSSGRIDISVAKIPPAITATFGKDNHGALKSGETDTVFFEFDSPLVGTPTFALNTPEDSSSFNQGEPFVSGSLSELKQTDEGEYYALYTAGDGNGTSEALFQDIKTTETYGSVGIDSAFVKLYRVDNIVPVADLSYSHARVNDSTVVTITATFTEAVTFDFQQPAIDSAMYISFSGGGVKVERDTLEATDNPLIYTYQYIVNGEGPDLLGTPIITVALENIVDLAGHALSATDNTDHLIVDNTAPSINGTATDSGSGTASISLNSDEDGTGWYLILEDGAEAPEGTADFASGVEWELAAGGTKSMTKLLSPGAYDVWFMANDEAGNFSAPLKEDLIIAE